MQTITLSISIKTPRLHKEHVPKRVAAIARDFCHARRNIQFADRFGRSSDFIATIRDAINNRERDGHINESVSKAYGSKQNDVANKNN